MSGNATFELTAQDHVDAVHAHTGRIFGKLSWVLLGVAMLFPLLDLWAGASILDDTAFWICLGLALFFLGWDWIARDWIVRRNFRQRDGMRSPIRIAWDDRCIRFETDNSHSEYRWDQFWRWMAAKKALLLYQDSQAFYPLPARHLPDGAIEEMVVALKAAGVKETGRWR